jgi:glutamyl-tRNA reductase
LTGEAGVIAEPGAIVALTAHARRVPSADRARLSELLRDAAVPGLVVETCHRVELFTTEGVLPSALVTRLPHGVERLERRDAASHAIAVAVGLDSVVVGEDQILHQLRAATTSARAAGRLDPAIDRLMNVALRAGRLARSWRSGPIRSMADAALEAVERRQVDLAGVPLLVVGAGEMGRLVLERARSRGAAVTVSSRTPARATDLARMFGVGSTTFDPGSSLEDFGVIVVALRGSWALSPATIHALVAGSAIVVDLSMPSSLPDALRRELGDRLISIDDLATSPAWRVPAHDHARLAALVHTSTEEYLDWLDGHRRRSTAEALVRLAEAERTTELDRLWRTCPELGPEIRSAIERMSQHLTNRLLREPLERLGHDDDGHATLAARELFAL